MTAVTLEDVADLSIYLRMMNRLNMLAASIDLWNNHPAEHQFFVFSTCAYLYMTARSTMPRI